MTRPFHPALGRRAALGLGLGLALPGLARAQATAPLSFQLSWIRSIQYGGYFSGVEQGAYARRGIEPTFVSGGPNIDPVANVAAGRSQLGDRPIGPLLIARDRGIPIKIIATVFQRSPFSIMSLAEKPIRTIRELEGKTIAVGTSNRPLVQNLVREAGLDPRSVNMVPSAPDPAALVAGQIDAYSGYSTNQGVILQQRGVALHILHVHDLGIPETAGTIYGREDFLAANRDLVVRFLRASMEGWNWAFANKEAAARMMVERQGAPGLNYEAQLTELRASEPFITAGAATGQRLLEIDLPLYDRIITLYRNVELIRRPMTAAELCDPSFIQAAHAIA